MDKLELHYIHQEITNGLRNIYRAQLDIAQHRIYQVGRDRRIVKEKGRTIKGRSGNLLQALQNPSFTAVKGELGEHAVMNYPVYIRFLDMREHGNYKIYNRQIWGILYSEVFRKIRWGFTQEVRDKVERDLRKIMNQLNINGRETF